MDIVFVGLGLTSLCFAVIITFAAGFVKGAVGFALPMIMISGLSSFLAPEIALAALILPTVVTNIWQALRGGLEAAILSVKPHWRFLVMMLIVMAFSAQLVQYLSAELFLLILGVLITVFVLIQLFGLKIRISPKYQRRAEVLIGALTGMIGGVSGTWGAPTVAYLTALETPKNEQMQVQGVIYAIGAFMLFAAHLQSGVLNRATLPLSALMILPALAGIAIGFRYGDRFDQQTFRRMTLFVLLIAGLNLIRRAL